MCVFFSRFVVRRVVLQCAWFVPVYRAPNRAVWSQVFEDSCSENEKNAVKPKTGGFVCFPLRSLGQDLAGAKPASKA